MAPLVPVACSSSLTCETDSVTVCEIPAESATVTSVPSSISTVTLSAANPDRRGLLVFNNSSSDLFLKLGVAASPTSFSFKVGTNGFYEVPFNYTGIVTGIWSAAVGSAEVTEVVN